MINSNLFRKNLQQNLTSNFSTNVPKIYGREAFETQVKISYVDGDTIWLKQGSSPELENGKFFYGSFVEDAILSVWRTKGTQTNRVKTKFHEDAFEILDELSRTHDEGIFYIPGKPEEFPLKEYCRESNDIGAEMDDGTEEDQRFKIESFAIHSGLKPNFLVSSGGKSLHPHLILNEPIEIEHRNYFSKLFAISLLGDPAVTNQHQPMRIAGFHRKEKGNDQYLQVFEKLPYSVEELEEGFRNFFEWKNYKFRTFEELSDTRWREIKRILASKTLSPNEKELEIRSLLTVVEELLPTNVQKAKAAAKAKDRAAKVELGIATEGRLPNAVKHWERELGADAFDWHGHDWKWSSDDHARGYCPFHDSSPTTGWIAPNVDGTWFFHCPSCDIGVTAFHYQYKLEHGRDAEHPSGKEWAEFAKKLTGYVDPEPYKGKAKSVSNSKSEVVVEFDLEVWKKAKLAEAYPDGGVKLWLEDGEIKSCFVPVDELELGEIYQHPFGKIGQIAWDAIAKNPKFPLVITNPKRAKELLAQGTLALSLPSGVKLKVAVEDQEHKELVNSLKIFADETRPISIEGLDDIPTRTLYASLHKQNWEYRRRERAAYKFTRKANVVVESGYLPTMPLDSIQSSLIGIKGDWGVGKSHAVAHWCKEWDGNIIQVAHLNALLSNTAPKFGLNHHKYLKAEKEENGGGLFGYFARHIAITDVSLGALLDVQKWSNGKPFILILDEVEQVLKSFQLNKNLLPSKKLPEGELEGDSRQSRYSQLRLTARARLEWLIKNATKIIASDRDLSDDTLEYVENIRKEKFYLIHHIGLKGTDRTINISRNKRKDELLDKMVKDIQAGLKIIIPCETRLDLLAIELLLQASGIEDKDMFFAHGDNSNEAGIKELIATIDKAYTQYQVFGYTMTCGTAISLEAEHYDKCYAFFTGNVLTATEQAQMLFRYRLPCEINIWCSPVRRTLEIDPDNMMLNLVSRNQETDKLIAKAVTENISDYIDEGILPQINGTLTDDEIPWLVHKLHIKAQGNASRANPLQSLCDVLESAGFTLNITCTDEENTSGTRTIRGEEHKEFKKEIKEANDKAIANAVIMDDVTYQSALINAGSATKELRDRISKTKLAKELGIEVTEDIVKLERSKNLTRGVKILRVALGDEATAVAHDLDDRAKRQDKADQQHYAKKRELLITLGITELISKLESDWSYTSLSPEVILTAHKVRDSRKEIKKYFGLNISAEMKPELKNDDAAKLTGNAYKWSNAKVIGTLLDYLCIPRSKSQIRDELGNQVYKYSLDQEKWTLIQTAIDHQNGGLKTPKMEGILRKLKTPVSTAETHAIQDVEFVTHQVDLYKKNKMVCDNLDGGWKPSNESVKIELKTTDPVEAIATTVPPVPPLPTFYGVKVKSIELSEYFRSFYTLDNLATDAWNQASLSERAIAAEKLGISKTLIERHLEAPTSVTRAEILMKAGNLYREDLEDDLSHWCKHYGITKEEASSLANRLSKRPSVVKSSNSTELEPIAF